MSDKMLEHYKSILQGVEKEISDLNIAGRYIVSFNVFITGVTIAYYDKILSGTNCELSSVILKILLLLLFLSTIAVFISLLSFISKGGKTSKGNKSAMFYQTIAKHNDADIYITETKKYSESSMLDDIKRKIFWTSKDIVTAKLTTKIAGVSLFVYMMLIYWLILLNK